MVKSSIFTVILLIAVFIVSLRLSENIQSGFLSATDSLKSFYIYVTDTISESITKHFNQTLEIENLSKENRELKEKEIAYINTKSELEAVLEALKYDKFKERDVELTRTLSYVKLGDFYRIWLNFNRENSDKIYGLVQNGYAAGIIVDANGRSLGLLNGAEKCSYGVYIGEEKAPGIIKSSGNGEEILVDYIPSWMAINVGDVVKTSGMDDIFFEGLEVGVVKEIKKSQGYKIAAITPFADVLHPKFFWVIKEHLTNETNISQDINITSMPINKTQNQIE